ncbi:MAG: flavodoxin domain-containing protein [Acidimicrobiia bacterium]|jgi:menaquinone-dependent protoporphyrinogen oxidase
MTVLVTAASKHGATAQIAKAIADALTRRGVEAVQPALDDVAGVDGYDAVVLGSAVYMGRWMKEAKGFVEHHRDALRARPVWLFSSGPLGDPLKPADDPVDAAAMVEASGAREHRVFPGEIAKDRLSLGERAVVKAVRAPYDDYRDWGDIDAWAAGIASALTG